MDITQLAPGDRPNTVYRYRVSGSGEFPLDMLRHDAAWPASTDDCGWIGHRIKRSLNLVSHHTPNVERWDSFGWKVEE